MIREMTIDDMKPVVRLLERLHASTSYRGVKPDWPTICQTTANLMARRSGIALVAEHNGEITGVLLAVAQTLWWQDEKSGARIASDLIFYSESPGDGLRMLKAMVKWAFSVPRVFRIECGVSSGQVIHRQASIYHRAGFVREGSFYVQNHPKYDAALAALEEQPCLV